MGPVKKKRKKKKKEGNFEIFYATLDSGCLIVNWQIMLSFSLECLGLRD
jgi:hypothetical protein